jgi:hypothetical protein
MQSGVNGNNTYVKAKSKSERLIGVMSGSSKAVHTACVRTCALLQIDHHKSIMIALISLLNPARTSNNQLHIQA